MGIKKCGCGIGSSQDEMLRCGCGGTSGPGPVISWPDNQNMIGGHQKLDMRSPLLANHQNLMFPKIMRCGCDLDNILGGSMGLKMLYLNTKNDYIGLNKFK